MFAPAVTNSSFLRTKLAYRIESGVSSEAMLPGIGSLVKPLHSKQALFALGLGRDAVSSFQRPDLGLAIICAIKKVSDLNYQIFDRTKA